MNERNTILIVGLVLIIFGSLGFAVDSGEPLDQPTTSTNTTESTLKVERATSKPQSAIDQLQGSGGLQNQGSEVQTGNAGANLQPNAGSGSLPAGY